LSKLTSTGVIALPVEEGQAKPLWRGEAISRGLHERAAHYCEVRREAIEALVL
jgi:hypothetical protein